MVLRYDPKARRESSARFWGQNTDWIRNIRVRPALQVIMTVLPRADRLTRTARRPFGQPSTRARSWTSSSISPPTFPEANTSKSGRPTRTAPACAQLATRYAR